MLPKLILERVNKIAKKIGKDKNKLIKIAEEKYNKMLIDPGEAIGTVTAQSIGEPGTQLTLRTKWLAGANEISITQGLPRIIEIFDSRKEPSTPSMTVYLKEPYNKDEKKVRNITRKLLEVDISDVSESIEIDLINMRINVIFNEEKLKEFKIKFDNLIDKFKDEFKRCKITHGDNRISIKPKEGDLLDLFKLKVKVSETFISGVKGISQVLPIFENDEWIIKTGGTNLKEILKIKEVDDTRTTSNNLHEVYDVLGVEAVRNLIIKEVMDVLEKQGVEVDIRHIMLVADTMTVDGVINGIGRYGVSGEKGSVLARASFEVPLKHLFNAATKNEIDPLASVVENIMINQPAPIGTGMIDIYIPYGEEK